MYYFSKTLKAITFYEAIEKITQNLKDEGFGVLTTIDLKSTFKNKLDVNFYNYTILGACNPQFAFQALSSEDKIGTMLPCNVIVQEKEFGKIEISAVNPLESMKAVQNSSLEKIALEVAEKLKNAINNL